MLISHKLYPWKSTNYIPYKDSNEEIFLVSRHGFHITLIEQTILIQKFINRLIYHLIRNVRTCFVPDEPSQMLDERREVL